MNFNFKRKRLSLQRAQYSNKRLALMIVMRDSGKRYGVLTVNTPEIDLVEGEFAIKTWGENKDIAQVIFNSGKFEDTRRRSTNGTITVEFWKFVDPKTLEEMVLYKQ